MFLVQQGDDISSDAIEQRLRKKYAPLIKADRGDWKLLSPFEVVYKIGRAEETEVWLETRLHHFSRVFIGNVLPHPPADDAYYEGNIPIFIRTFKHRNAVIFGNATQAS